MRSPARDLGASVGRAADPTFTTAAMLLGVRMEEVLFVANHAFDCVGAKSAGMRTAFINRRQRPFGVTPYQPDIVTRTMTELADVML